MVRARCCGARARSPRDGRRRGAPDREPMRSQLVGSVSLGSGIVPAAFDGRPGARSRQRASHGSLRARHAAPGARRTELRMTWATFAEGVAWFSLTYFLALGIGYLL